MKHIFIFILSFVWSLGLQASLDMPRELEVYSTGYVEAPIVQCPRGAKKYQDMLDQLDGLKKKIRSEACPQSQLDALNGEVASLESLITDDRESFIQLVQQGIGESQQLSGEQVEQLQTYIDQVVKKVASVTGLINNPACFDEGDKVSTLSFLSSVVAEVSGVLGALSGPYGAKISLGGQLASSLISSIDQVVQARKTYDYSEREDRNNYLQNLCAYYQFKGDLDKETQTMTYAGRLWDLADAAEALLQRLEADCNDCSMMIEDYQSRLGRDMEYRIFRDHDGYGAPLPNGKSLVRSVSVEDMTLRDLYEFYFRGDILSGEPLPEFKLAPIPGEPASGELTTPALRVITLRALQAHAWFEEELEKVRENDAKGLSDDGRREVMRVQADIEDFLVHHEGPRYVKHYRRQLRSDMHSLEREALKAVNMINGMRVIPDGSFDYRSQEYYTTQALHDLFRGPLEFDNLWFGADPNQDEFKRQRIAELTQPLISALELVRMDHGILANRCLFFERSNYDYVGGLRASCQSAQSQLARSQQLMNELKTTSFGRRHGNKLSFVNQEPQKYVGDWLASVTSVITQDLHRL